MSIAGAFTDGCTKKVVRLQEYRRTHKKIPSGLWQSGKLSQSRITDTHRDRQTSILRNFGLEYLGLVSAIQTELKEENNQSGRHHPQNHSIQRRTSRTKKLRSLPPNYFTIHNFTIPPVSLVFNPSGRILTCGRFKRQKLLDNLTVWFIQVNLN